MISTNYKINSVVSIRNKLNSSKKVSQSWSRPSRFGAVKRSLWVSCREGCVLHHLYAASLGRSIHGGHSPLPRLQFREVGGQSRDGPRMAVPGCGAAVR